ncbi:hypothetical protein PSCICO_31750 [Pseudomonas cichorii]|uniref:hypothetical protein n=1 Tax=Pseudomonas cichorii TaxID=36746 RepID=UPI001910AF8D|nr:hypothetical protein [Pseudomonas cichorii]GFM87776.1 hypothetical protein PSCICO_31750 [Pseudomonas cichorii]
MLIFLVLTVFVVGYYCMGLDGGISWGTFGDYFGGVLNPILSFLALFAVVRGLGFQFEELKGNREEAKSALDLQLEQTKIFKQQSFESVFFGLLQLYSKSIDELELGAVIDGGVSGASVMKYISEKANLDIIVWDEIFHAAPLRVSQIKPTIIYHLGEEFLPLAEGGPIRSFKILSQLLLHIDLCDLSNPSLKQSYFMIAKSLLTPAEIECAALYAFTHEGRELYEVMIRNSFLKYLPQRASLSKLKDCGLMPNYES